MKKLILSAAIVLGSLSLFAIPVKNNQSLVHTVVIGDEYTEIKVADLPAVITESLLKAFPDAEIQKAFVNENNEYKLEVKLGDKTETMYSDANGKWMDK
ncbi:hypothetical protein FFWV33_05750 [Flavobacterium faecale]|uniref:Beta-lactamase-inhibitor-like PepSY-like domain-containing protein n=1 Tax=Flavobacterium faecale TaxID=1355330 RepID=A0A2S1LBC5_9FLAO|nr:hypothetical protein [Flavobacterium faecale]AWG21070.1 hypothetical protein FFWV33_05750 [Flavobacterium faecale]